ncbi:hypothetical protein [Streptomyces sp. NPDC023838]|uniref:hypothetical protein n=1 Tax=Streptomyces sp. NPDC023838 TaxID=3154325 RepID=UPI0033DE7B1E
MKPKPITPTRIIPSGTPLPLPAAPPQPPPPPMPPFAWPWPDPPTPGPVEVHVVVDVLQRGAQPIAVVPDAPRWDWSWMTRLLGWRTLTAGAAAVLLPLPPDGHGPVATWSEVLHTCRAAASIGGAYALAIIGASVALLLDQHTGRWWARLLTLTALIGGTGAMGWYDPVTLVTGVTR